MAQKFNNGAVDEKIVRLNEFKAVKMAQLSRGKRPAAKFNKEVAIYMLTNWDNVEALKTCFDAMRKDMPEGCEEVMNIYSERISVLETKQEKSQKKAANTKKSGTKNKKSESKPGAPKIRKVGDRHPNHPWIWTEYKKGKFDWRIDPALKQRPGKKAGATAIQSKKKKVAGKAEKAEPAAAPKLTLAELLAKPTPQGLSKSQQSVIKFLKKGFRLRKDGNAFWLTDADGNNERTEKGVLEALQRRYKIGYIPNDIWCGK